jgi:endogenous inhibitor of DNA gyrase (YacG/DUF329 family)
MAAPAIEELFSRMTHRCPICGKPTNSERDTDFPFCSERCRLRDLGNWSAERYVISRPAFDEEMLDQPATQPPEKHGRKG